MAVFGINLLVVSFDFPRTVALTWFFAIVSLVLAAILVNAFVWELLPPLADLSGRLDPVASDDFYWLVGGGLGLVYGAIILANRRFDYYTVESLRIIHHHGILDTRDQYPALGSTIQKDITDVFEYLLLRSGRLIIQPERGPAIVLENVPRIDRKVAQLEMLLSELPVEVHGPARHAPGAAAP